MIKISHFADFEQEQNPLGETGGLGIFFLRPLPCVTGTPPIFSDLLGSPLALSSTPTLGFFLIPKHRVF